MLPLHPFLKWLPLQQNFQVIRQPEDNNLDPKISIMLEHSPDITWLLDTTLSFHRCFFFWQWHRTLFLDNCKLWRNCSRTIWPKTRCFPQGTRKDERPSCSWSYDCHESAHVSVPSSSTWHLKLWPPRLPKGTMWGGGMNVFLSPTRQDHFAFGGLFLMFLPHWGSFGLAKWMST